VAQAASKLAGYPRTDFQIKRESRAGSPWHDVPKETRSINYSEPSTPALVGDDFGKDVVNWIFPAYVTLIVLCVFLFLLKSTMTPGHEMSLDRAVLTAVNAATLTGFPQPVGVNSLKTQGQVAIIALTIAGSLFSLLCGGLAMRRILRLPYTDRQIVYAAIVCEAVALVVGAAGGCGLTGGTLDGASQGLATFGNSGVFIGKPFAITAWQTHVIVVPLMFFGSLGITVLIELYDLLVHAKRISKHAVIAVGFTLGLYVIGTIVFTLLQTLAVDFNMTGSRFAAAVASSSVAAINSRTAGIHFEDAYLYPRAMQWILIVFMVIGASPASTGGGIKTTTVYALFRGTRDLLAGRNPGRAFGIAMSWVGLYAAMLLAGLILLLMAEPQMNADRVAFLAASALGNVGLSHDVLSNSPKGSYVLCALMLAGRMVPPLILWWMAETVEGSEVAVG
jgi:trk system potassium uptake protein TrkH